MQIADSNLFLTLIFSLYLFSWAMKPRMGWIKQNSSLQQWSRHLWKNERSFLKIAFWCLCCKMYRDVLPSVRKIQRKDVKTKEDTKETDCAWVVWRNHNVLKWILSFNPSFQNIFFFFLLFSFPFLFSCILYFLPFFFIEINRFDGTCRINSHIFVLLDGCHINTPVVTDKQ